MNKYIVTRVRTIYGTNYFRLSTDTSTAGFIFVTGLYYATKFNTVSAAQKIIYRFHRDIYTFKRIPLIIVDYNSLVKEKLET